MTFRLQIRLGETKAWREMRGVEGDEGRGGR